MGKKTHGPILVAAIEHSDFEKVREVLLTHIKTKQRIQELCTSEVRRLASDYTEVPLLLAATLPDPTIIQFLVLKQDVNINYVHKEVVKRKTKVKTALILAVRSGLVSTVDAILAMNADPNIQDHKLRTALHHAVRKADYRMAKMLLTRGAQPNIVDSAGNTPLHIATIFGHTELVKLLVKHDSDLFKKGTGGAIPIHMAAKEGHNVLVRLFCQYDVNVNTKVPCYDQREKAPIHVAAEEGHAETVATLLEDCGADPNIRDSMGETPLHCACLREYDPLGMKSKDEYTETVRVLLNSGAHIDLQNSRGETPLHLATRNEFQKTVELLIHAGSDPTIEDNGGYKPYDLATADDTVTIQLLKSAMEERIRIMNDAMEVRAKGYSTSLVKPSISSRSALSVNSLGSNEFILASGGPNGSNAVYEDGYLKPVGLRSRSNTKGSSLTGSSQDIFGKNHSTSSSGGSKSEFNRGKKKSQSLLPQFRVKGSASNQRILNRTADSHASISETRPRNNSCSSPSNTNQKNTRNLPEPPVEMRNAGLGQQRVNKGAEVDSFWDVTPRNSTSTCENEPVQPAQPQADELGQYESLPDNDLVAVPATGNSRGRPIPGQSSPAKRAIQIQPAFPNGNKIPTLSGKNETADSDDDDSFYDDESFDTLDTLSEREAPAVPPKPSKAKLAQQRLKYTPEEKRKIQNAVSNQSLHSWLEEQADIIQKDGLPEPPSMKQANSVLNDEDSTMSEFSSVSKSHRDQIANPHQFLVDKKDAPPPLPPKPGVRVASRQQQQQQQQRQQVAQPQTVIRVIPKDSKRPPSPVSESTSYSQSTQPYATGYYDSLNSRPDTEESHSEVTDSTLMGPTANRERRRAQQQNGSMQTFKGLNRKPAISSINDESSENTNWERVPVSDSSNLYWEHTGSTQGIYEAKKDTRQKVQQSKAQPARRQISSYGDSSDSLSWKSGDELNDDVDEETDENIDPDEDDETTVVSQQINKGGNIAKLRQNLESELRFHKSMGDIHSHSSQQKMERQMSESQSLSGAMLGYRNDQQLANSSAPRSGSVEIIEMQRRANPQYSMKRAQSEKGLGSDDDLLDDRKVTIGKETVIPDNARTGSSGATDERIVRYDPDRKQPLKLVGGNSTGVFIHEVENKSKAAEQDLRVGDRIVKINNRSARNMTREDVYNILKGIKDTVIIVLRNEMNMYQKVLSNGGSGDSFFIKCHFAYDASSKSEFSFKKGDVFSVKDTMPLGKQGLWRVAKVNNASSREQIGYIPNKFRADQIATSFKIAQLRAEEIRNKGGFIRKSFKRAKSLDRGMNKVDGDDFKEALKDVKSYERVTHKTPDFRKPVVLLGLFCDSVRDILLQDQPDRFAMPKGAIELASNAPTGDTSVPPVNTRPIEIVMQQGKHCLLILSPSNIKYLQENTQLNPIVIYLCPSNKAIVKSLKARFAPGFERKAGFMYDEAVQFLKRHHDLFSTTVTYTNNGEWSKNLKDTIAQLQEQPIWVPLEVDESSSDEEDEDDVGYPVQPQPFKQALIRQQGLGERGRSRKPYRVSKTTDDLPDVPDEIRDVLNRHIGAATQPSSRLRNYSVDVDLGRDVGGVNYQDHHQDEGSTVSNQSQVNTSYSSSSGGAKPKRSILKNKNQSSVEDSSGGDAESFATMTSSSGVRQRDRQTTRSHARAITIERAETAPSQPVQQHTQPVAARQQYILQKRETPL